VNSGEEDYGQRITWLASRGGRPEACGGNGGAVGDRWQLSVSVFLFFFSLLLSVLYPSPLLFFSFCSLAVAVLHGSGATVVATGDWFQAVVLLLLLCVFLLLRSSSCLFLLPLSGCSPVSVVQLLLMAL
jgi:hypothetical protein